MPANFNDLSTLQQKQDAPGQDIARSIEAGQKMALQRQQLMQARERLQEQKNLLTYKKLRSVVGLLQQAAKEKDFSNKKMVIETAMGLAQQYGFVEVAEQAQKNLMYAVRDQENYKQWIGSIAQGIESGDPEEILEKANLLSSITQNPADFVRQYSSLRGIQARKDALALREDMQKRRMAGQAVNKLEATAQRYRELLRQAQNDLKILGEDPNKVKLFEMREAALGLTRLIQGVGAVPQGREHRLAFESYKNQLGGIIDKIRNSNEETASPTFVRDLQKAISRLSVSTVAAMQSSYENVAKAYSGNLLDPVQTEKLIAGNRRQGDLILKNIFRAHSSDSAKMDRAEKFFRMSAERLNRGRPPENQFNADDYVKANMERTFKPGELKYRDAIREIQQMNGLGVSGEIYDPQESPFQGMAPAPSAPSQQEQQDDQDDADMKAIDDTGADLGGEEEE